MLPKILPSLDDPQFEQKLKLWQASRDRWEFGLKMSSAILLLVGAFLAVRQYQSQRQALIRQNEEAQQQRIKDFNSTIYRARLDVYLEATETFSRFVYANNRKEAESAEQHFWELYDGKFSIIEDEQARDEMVLAGYFVDEWDKCKPIPLPDLFQDLAYDFTQSCRRSLKTVFPKGFNPLTGGESANPPRITCEMLKCVCNPKLAGCKDIVANKTCEEATR